MQKVSSKSSGKPQRLTPVRASCGGGGRPLAESVFTFPQLGPIGAVPLERRLFADQSIQLKFGPYDELKMAKYTGSSAAAEKSGKAQKTEKPGKTEETESGDKPEQTEQTGKKK